MFNGSAVINASGNLSIDGGSQYAVFFNSSGSTVETQAGKSGFNMSSTKSSPVDNNGSNNTFSPATWGSAVAPSFSDPLATVATPTYTGATTSCGSPTIWSVASSGCVTANGTSSVTLASGIYGSVTIGVPATLNPGEYGSLTTQSTVTFNPGIYVFYGSGITTWSTSTLEGSGVSFYFTCGSASPASCGTWNSTKDTCSSQQSGAEVDISGTTTLDLSAGGSDNNILFFYDRCNNNGDAFFVNSGGLTADSGFPSGALYADSGTVFLNAGTTAVPSPIITNNIYYNTSSATLGTSTGSVALGGGSSNPGNLVK